MPVLQRQDGGWISAAALPEEAPAGALEIIARAGAAPLLAVAGSGGGGIALYALAADGSAAFTGYAPFGPAESALSGMALAALDGGAQAPGGPVQLLAAGPAAGGLSGFAAGASGAPGPARALAAPEGRITAAAVHEGTARGPLVFTAATDGLAAWRLGPAGAQALDAQAPGSAGPAAALAVLDSAAGPLLASAHAGSNAVEIRAIGADGSLGAAQSYGAAEGAGLRSPAALETARAGGQDYLILAASGSDSLTVLAAGADGSLRATAHVTDSLATRFQGARQIETAEYGSWTLLAAAGSDGGASLFALLPGGGLSLLASLAWDSPPGATRSIRGLAGLEMAVLDGSLHLYAAPEGTRAVQHAVFGLAGLGRIAGTAAPGAAVSGSAGDDILQALAPGQTLAGGAGADTFIFSAAAADADGQLGRITDFDPAGDRLDLSALPGGGADLVPGQDGSSLVLHAGGFSLVLEGLGLADLGGSRADPASLLAPAADSLDTALFTLPDGPPPEPEPEPAPPAAVPGAGLVLAGSGGADLLRGQAGADRLTGGAGDDLLYGGAGDDVLLGQDGADTLEGGAGADTLNGGAGHDRITGGPDTGDLRDVIYAGAGNDSVAGGGGNDLIYGQDGNDTLAGGFGADTLQGQDGDDVITGSAFSDQVFGNAGDDFVNGGFGHDRVNGGPGADVFYHLGIAGHGSDWIQDYSAAGGDVLLFGTPGAAAEDFQVNFTHTASRSGARAGADDVPEAFVIYRPTGQILWALVDGAGEEEINLSIAGSPGVFDLLA